MYHDMIIVGVRAQAGLAKGVYTMHSKRIAQGLGSQYEILHL